MPEFEYTAKNQDQKVERGMMVAQDRKDLERKIIDRGLTLNEAHVGSSRSVAKFFERFQTVPMVQRMFFTQYLQVMIRAGFSIGRALATLANQTTSKYFRKIILDVRADVEAGMTFSKSLAKYPKVFNEMFVNMISAGETSGKLDEVLGRLSVKMKKDHGLISKVKSAMTYPVIILVVMVAVAILMMLAVIPKLTEVFQESGAALPLATRVLVSMSSFLLHHGYLALAAAVILIIILGQVLRTKRGKFIYDSFILRLPIIGPIVQHISIARFSRSLSSLLETNIPIIETFSIISRTMGNVHYRKCLEEAGQELKTGNTIARVLAKYPRLFPPLVTQMISVGEESGSLDSISGDLAAFYEDEVDQTMASLSTILEPILMLILGIGVAGMAIAVILPIYSLSQQLG